LTEAKEGKKSLVHKEQMVLGGLELVELVLVILVYKEVKGLQVL
jgi:hypothetical protein